MLVASFGMYPFPHLRASYQRVWDAVRNALISAGVDECETTLDWDHDVHARWRDPNLVMGVTCGWPLVTALREQVEVIGHFDVDVPFACDGQYRSVFIASRPLSIGQWRERGDAIVAANSLDSLSGWVSLCHEWGSAPERHILTGSHLASMRAVADGRAHVASIDALSFEHIVRADPTTGGVHVVGHGPVVPTLPLICAARLSHQVPSMRAAIAAAMSDPNLADDWATLRLRGFVPADRWAYDHLPALLPPSR